MNTKILCPALSEIARAASGYYDGGRGYDPKVAIEKAIADFPPHSQNMERQIGPLRIRNDCEKYGVTNLTKLKTAIAMVIGTHGGLVAAERKHSAAA